MLRSSLKMTPWKRNLSAQHVLQPETRESCRLVVARGEDHMRRHDALQAVVDQADERLQILLHQGIEAAPVDRQIEMRIGNNAAMPGKVLCRR